MKHKIYAELLQLKGEYEQNTVDIVEGLPFNTYSMIKTIEFYSNSKYLKGQTDSLGREKPFFNIVNANVDLSVVATDIDTKDIKISSAEKKDYIRSFLLQKEVQGYMRETNFAKFLNDMGEVRARYGGVLVKKVEADGELKLQVPEWKNLIVDHCHIIDRPIIEKHYMTPAELEGKRDVWQNIDDALKLFKGRKKPEIYEIHGEFPANFLDGEEGEEYIRQVHYFISKGDSCVILFQEKEDENPYKYLPWKTVSGRGLGRGIVEEGEQAQVWTNDSILAERDVMSLTGKVIAQTASKKYNGRNIITEIDNGTILEHEENKPLTSLQLTPNSLPQFQNLIQRWQSQFDRTGAVTDSLRGETPPSGQAFRLQALITQQSSSQFDYRREEAGIFLKELFYDWVIPHLIKRLKKAHTLVAKFSADELSMIDEAFINYEVSRQIEKAIKKGQFIDPMQVQMAMEDAREKLMRDGDRRFLDIPDDYYKGIRYTIEIEITGEQKNKAAMLETLSSIFTIAQNPGVRQDPVLNDLLMQIMELAGISPVNISSKPAPIVQPQPGMGGTAEFNAPDAQLPEVADVGPQANA